MSNQQTDDLPAKIKYLEKENELILLQLHRVQEELEVYFLKFKELEARRGSNAQVTSGANIAWVDDELPEALAEVERLKTLAQLQAEIRDIESRNALNVKLGNMLLEGTNSVGGIIKIPFSLLVFWRNVTRKHIPAALGGKEFTRVIKAYDERGFDGANGILEGNDLPPICKANAYTVLARHLMRRDAKASAEAARKAFEIDPKPYRLKWLAYRELEAGNAQKAEALFALLPEGMTYSDSESKQISRIRYEAKNQRQQDARQKTKIVSKQQQIQNQLSALNAEKVRIAQARDDVLKQLNELKDQFSALNAEKVQIAQARDDVLKQLNELKGRVQLLDKEKAVLTSQCKKSSTLAEVRRIEIETLERERGGLGEMIRDLLPFFYGRRLTYVDIGAYVGDVFLALKKSELKIREAHLVEPNSQSYKTLVENTSKIMKNGGIHHYCLALDIRPGQLRLIPGASMTKIDSSNPVDRDVTDTFVVESTTLDLIVDRTTERHVDLLKIDVEGFEENVLRGGQRGLNQQLIDVIIIEVGMNPKGKQQCYYRKIDDFLQVSGYRVFRIYEQKNEWMSDLPFMRRANFVYMSEKFAKSNPYLLTQELFEKEKMIEELKFKIKSDQENV